MPPTADTTRLILELGNANLGAAQRLLPLVYDELRTIADASLRRERAGHTLQPTALVHEVFLKLVGTADIEWRGRAQFLALAARQVRQVLVDHARRHAAAKRGGAAGRSTIDWSAIGDPGPIVDLIALDEAMSALAERSSRQHEVVTLRFFGGMGVEEVAEVLGVSERTVKSEWRAARAWLRQRIED